MGAHIPCSRLNRRTARHCLSHKLDRLNWVVIVLPLHRWCWKVRDTCGDLARLLVDIITCQLEHHYATWEVHKDGLIPVRCIVEPRFGALHRSCNPIETSVNLKADVVLNIATNSVNNIWIVRHFPDRTDIVNEVNVSKILNMLSHPREGSKTIVVEPFEEGRYVL